MSISQSTREVENMGTHCMHEVHRNYKYTVPRRDEAVVAIAVGVVVVAV
jgi:hypothetical protein